MVQRRHSPLMFSHGQPLFRLLNNLDTTYYNQSSSQDHVRRQMAGVLSFVLFRPCHGNRAVTDYLQMGKASGKSYADLGIDISSARCEHLIAVVL